MSDNRFAAILSNFKAVQEQNKLVDEELAKVEPASRKHLYREDPNGWGDFYPVQLRLSLPGTTPYPWL